MVSWFNASCTMVIIVDPFQTHTYMCRCNIVLLYAWNEMKEKNVNLETKEHACYIFELFLARKLINNDL